MSDGPADRPVPSHEVRRIGWVDDARGIGILLVVVGHVLRGLKPAGILDDSPAYRLADAWIYAFHMPLFFILSGLFAERKARRDGRTFLAEMAATIVYPYLVWSALQTVLQIAMSGSVNKQIGPRDLLTIPTTPVMQFWFLYALFLIACAYQAMRRLGLSPAAAAGLFAVAWGASRLHPEFLPWFPILSAAWYGIYYALGAVANLRDRVVASSLDPAATLPIAVVGYASVAAWIAYNPTGLPGPVRIAGDLAAALAGAAATIALAMLTAETPATRVLGAWGRASLPIFVAHTIFSAATRIVLIKVLKVQSPAAHIVLGTVGGLLPSLLLAQLAERWSFPYLFRWPLRRPAPAARA